MKAIVRLTQATEERSDVCCEQVGLNGRTRIAFSKVTTFIVAQKFAISSNRSIRNSLTNFSLCAISCELCASGVSIQEETLATETKSTPRMHRERLIRFPDILLTACLKLKCLLLGLPQKGNDRYEMEPNRKFMRLTPPRLCCQHARRFPLKSRISQTS
jgi:hypothetical protein